MNDLTGKTVLITGGASGLGLATAHTFIRANALGVTLVDLSAAALVEALATFTSAEQLRLHTVTADVGDEKDTIRYVAETVAKWGKLDVSVQNAGINQPGCGVDQLDLAMWEKVMRVCATGPFLGVKHSAKAFMANPDGPKGCNLILTGSQLGLDGQPNVSAYAAAKFAVRGLALSAAAELGVHGIRVNVICPGPVLTPLMTGTIAASEYPTYIEKTMLKKMGEPDDIAHGMLFLATSSLATGTTLKVDGGFSRWG
ncbi:hypothetical protein RQP46_003584 [Phenoliferia psychrophenolica]